MHRIGTLSLAIFVFPWTPAFGDDADQSPPNIILILADDLGWRDVQSILAYSATHAGSDIDGLVYWVR